MFVCFFLSIYSAYISDFSCMYIHIHAYMHVPRLLLVTPGGCFKDPVLVHPFWRLAMLPSVPSTMAEVCGDTSESLVLMLVRTEAT